MEIKRKIRISVVLFLVLFLLGFIIGGVTSYSSSRGYDINKAISRVENGDCYIKDLTIELADRNKVVYNIRNEMMFRNKEISLEKASYQAMVIYSISREYEVDPYLMVAIGIIESELSHTRRGEVRISHAGARGIFQITPIIERKYNIKAGVFEENVRGSVQFIRDLHRQYNDDLIAVLGHYNGGVNPYWKIENYPETRNYVREVRRVYSAILNCYK